MGALYELIVTVLLQKCNIRLHTSALLISSSTYLIDIKCFYSSLLEIMLTICWKVNHEKQHVSLQGPYC